MKKGLLNILLIFLFSATVFAQVPTWVYKYKISFGGEDTSYAQPYLCQVADNGRLWVVSSKIFGLGGHNAVFFADSTDRTFTRFIDYDKNGDSDTLLGNIGFLRGISTLKNDILISASAPYQRSKPNTVGTHYYYKNSDTLQVEKFGFYHTGSGYGSYLFGSALTPDSFAICGVYQSTMRFYNFTKSITSPGRGSFIPPAPYLYPEIGGHDPSGISIIRDIAIIPNGDYTSTEVPYYTTRNANLPSIQGGIGVWQGGNTASPKDYQCQRVSDAMALLALDNSFPYGITVDKNKTLWVAGTDTLRRWVKGFTMLGAFAMESAELPSQYSMTNPDPTGAPFKLPADVALSPDALTAYVIDVATRAAYKFKFEVPSSVDNGTEKPNSFELKQNYPNPFNPSTLISYNLPSRGVVRLSVHNSLGQEVAVLVNGLQEEGPHSKEFKANGMPSGIYYYTLKTDKNTVTKKMVLTK